MNWSKRTPQQIDDAVESGDYTGGYEFLPWMWYMRRRLVIIILFDFVVEFFCWKDYRVSGDVSLLLFGIFFGWVVPGIILGLSWREFTKKKKGISQ